MEVSSKESHSAEAGVPSVGRQHSKGRELVERVVNVKKAASSEAELAEPLIELPDLLIEAEHIVQSTLHPAPIQEPRQYQGGVQCRYLRALPR